jgi:predicted amidohydrolase YtcJ
MRIRIIIACCITWLSSCSQREDADLIVYNAKIYTVDSTFSLKEAMVIRQDRILATGTKSELEKKYKVKNQLDAAGKFVYPGFIDAHAHFVGYGLGLQQVNLAGTESWEEILQKLIAFEKTLTADQWLIGRGWDQNDWENKVFPTNQKLNELFPGRPVLLSRIDGHAAIANSLALEKAGIRESKFITGGEIETKNGQLTGILIDNAIDLVSRKIPPTTPAYFREALLDAQQNCFAQGLTTIDDCGLSFHDVEGIRSLQEKGELKMRLYVMLSDEKSNFDYLDKTGIIRTDRLTVRGFKVYGDGALGSRGACLLEPYSDKPGSHGFLLSRPEHFDSVAQWIAKRPFQMCTHAIGDSGNRTILKVYEKYLGGRNDRRWRIEHAQVVNENDFKLFAANNIIPSVQPTHATSDMYWAGERLGPQREKGAYAFKRLLTQNGWLPLGTDFPVEDISPFKTFYAAVVRKDAKQWPDGGYQPENALTREEALRGMTTWAARANFEENDKGSLEAGKFADFIILDKDLMTANETDLLGIQVLYTFLGGEMVYKRK